MHGGMMMRIIKLKGRFREQWVQITVFGFKFKRSRRSYTNGPFNLDTNNFPLHLVSNFIEKIIFFTHCGSTASNQCSHTE